jgi:Ni/Co efflux regulator RcnB
MSLALPIQGTKKRIVENQRATDIIRLMLISEQESQKYFPALRKYFLCSDQLETAKKIFEYSQNHLIYDREPPENQNVKTVARVLHDKYNDCKGFSTFILCALRACGIPARFRFASYNFWDKTPTHVYVIAKIDGSEYVMDGVIKRFNEEAAYKHFSDVQPKPLKMALNYLGATPAIGRKSKADRKAKRAAKKESKAVKKEERKEKRRKVVAKVAAGPARAAFLILVAANAFKLGDKLAEGYRKDPNKIKGWWSRFGGEWGALVQAVNKRAKQPIGSVSLTAAIATATPILIAEKKLIDELGLFKGKSDQDSMDLDQAIDDGISTLESDPNVVKSVAVTDADFQSGKLIKSRDLQKSKGTKSMDVQPTDASAPAQADDESEETDNTMLYLGLGVAAAFILPKVMGGNN